MLRDEFKTSKYSCILVGEGNLTFICARILAESELTLTAVVSCHEKIKTWCKCNNIVYISSAEDYTDQLSQLDFHYLICVINENKLSADILTQAKICAINYHDSLLPRYSGVHATSWAIINGELEHGISWHIMNDKIDGGDLVLCKKFDIHPEETSFSLNAKCFDAAIKSLPELIELLLQPPLVTRPQNEDFRTVFYKADKPANNGLITADMSLTLVDRFLRAAFFGHIDNDFFSVKIKIGKTYYQLLQAKCIFKKHDHTPNTITEISSNKIVVAFQEGYLELVKLSCGPNILDASDFAKQKGLREGMQITFDDSHFLKNYYHVVKTNHHKENKLINILRQSPLPDIGLPKKNAELNKSFLPILSIRLEIDDQMFIALLCMFISEYTQLKNFIIPIQICQDAALADYKELFLNYSFIYINLSDHDSLEKVHNALSRQLTQLPLLQSDLTWRYNGVSKILTSLPFLLSVENEICNGSGIVFKFYEQNFSILIDRNGIIPSSLEEFIKQFLIYLSSVNAFSDEKLIPTVVNPPHRHPILK